MKHPHDQEKAQFKKLFQQEGIDRFEDRFAVLETFLQTEGHVTADDLDRLLQRNGKNFEIQFVRDTLKRMCDFGFAQRNHFDNGNESYEHRHLGQHHDHMICTKCRKIIEFENDAMEALQLQIAEAAGFHMLQHRMEIYGLCDACAKKRDNRIPLTTAKPGERVKIIEFSGGSGAKLRLAAMGFRVGDEIEIVTNQSSGQMVVAVDFNRYILGRGLAQKIWVQPEKR